MTPHQPLSWRRAPGTLRALALWLAIVQVVDSYAEISPSLTGLHILVRGALPPGGRRELAAVESPVRLVRRGREGSRADEGETS